MEGLSAATATATATATPSGYSLEMGRNLWIEPSFPELSYHWFGDNLSPHKYPLIYSQLHHLASFDFSVNSLRMFFYSSLNAADELLQALSTPQYREMEESRSLQLLVAALNYSGNFRACDEEELSQGLVMGILTENIPMR